MKTLLCMASAALMLSTSAWAHDDHAAPVPSTTSTPQSQAGGVKLDAHAKEDIQRHRGMAHAHEQAAQCLERGTSYDECQKQLQTACKGLALGKNCGMRHVH